MHANNFSKLSLSLSLSALMIILPTRDLVSQVAATVRQLLYYLEDAVPEAVELLKPGKGEEGTRKVTEARLRTTPAIVVGTPSGVLEYKVGFGVSAPQPLHCGTLSHPAPPAPPAGLS